MCHAFHWAERPDLQVHYLVSSITTKVGQLQTEWPITTFIVKEYHGAKSYIGSVATGAALSSKSWKTFYHFIFAMPSHLIVQDITHHLNWDKTFRSNSLFVGIWTDEVQSWQATNLKRRVSNFHS